MTHIAQQPVDVYSVVKARHQAMCVKIHSPLGYAVWNPADPGRVEMLTHKQVIACFKHVMYLKPVSGTRNIEKKFITKWLADGDKARCEAFVVEPTLPFGPLQDASMRGGMVFNKFPGFRATYLAPVDGGDVEQLVLPLVRHVHAWIAGNHDGRTQWFLNWLANILQRPLDKHKTGLVVNGEPYYAKGILPGFFRECVLGADCSFQTLAAKDSVFARFSVGVESVVFLQLDEELQGIGERGQLNGLITEDLFNYEERYKDPTTIRNLVNVYMTTDSTTVKDISWKYALFDADRMEDDEDLEYVIGLREHLARPEVARAFYQFLMARDLSGFKTCSLPPPIAEA